MGVEYPAASLHIQPTAIPAIRAEIASTLATVRGLVARMGQEAVLDRPWLGDPESATTMKYYNDTVMHDPDGPFQATHKWLDDLQRTDEALAASEAHYRRTEGDNAALWGRA
jgi:hypothetical protein